MTPLILIKGGSDESPEFKEHIRKTQHQAGNQTDFDMGNELSGHCGILQNKGLEIDAKAFHGDPVTQPAKHLICPEIRSAGPQQNDVEYNLFKNKGQDAE
jgi:hypothetical protein